MGQMLKAWLILATVALLTWPFLFPVTTLADDPGSVADHVVISEVYVNAVNESGSEWIELYNPTDKSIDISAWTIATPTSDKDATIPSGKSIPPHGFFLIADEGFSTNKDDSSWVDADYEETITLGNENSWVCLKDSGGNIVDKVGWGSEASVYEGSPYPDNPPQGQSLERKTGDGEEYGPGWDTDNNANDFHIRTSPNPQNSGSQPLPPVPELPTIILFFVGLIALAVLLVLKRPYSHPKNSPNF